MSPEGIRAISLLHYCLAYDWVQHALDPDTDRKIRDRLAALADIVYGELNADDTDRYSISFVDHHGQAYPILGIAGVVLCDYVNPGGQPLASDPEEWRRVGTDYLFVNDPLHAYGRPLIDFEVDAEGHDLLGSYKNYYIDDMVIWAQVYTRFYGNNFFSAYPVAQKLLTAEVWDSLPNRYSANFVTNGNQKWYYSRGIASLLDPANLSYILKHDDIIEKSGELEYSKTPYHLNYDTQLPESVLYCVYGDYSSVPREDPVDTSRLSLDSAYQVFRESWDKDSDWLAMITFGKNIPTYTYRNTQHHDQMSFEYYAKGDLLLADAGEDRQSTNNYKGAYEVHHNTIAIENPRKAYSIAKWSGSPARGIFKGTKMGWETTADVWLASQDPWMEAVGARAAIRDLIGSSSGSSTSLSSPIAYGRLILYPEKDYFIVLDRLEGEETWAYRNIFRPSSLSITPSGKSIGHVNGDLSIGGEPYDWLSLSYKKEYSTGIQTNSIGWSTTNPYGKAVNMEIFTVPASDVLVMKNIGRVGGYDEENEVYNPVVYFRSGPSADLYRATVLLTGYAGEGRKVPSVVPVNGSGNALKISSGSFEDYVYTGAGTSSFASFITDADAAYIRVQDGLREYTLIGGNDLAYGDERLVHIDGRADYLTFKIAGNTISFNAAGAEGAEITLYQLDPSIDYRLEKDGVAYNKCSRPGDKRQITISL
jgi:hypothetical protein